MVPHLLDDGVDALDRPLPERGLQGCDEVGPGLPRQVAHHVEVHPVGNHVIGPGLGFAATQLGEQFVDGGCQHHAQHGRLP